MFVIFALLTSCLLTTGLASAKNADWTSVEITVERHPEYSSNPSDYGTRGACTNQEVALPNAWGYYQPTVNCVYQARTFTYTFYDGRLFLNLSGSGVMYPLANYGFASSNYVAATPYTDDILFGSAYMKDVPSHIESNNDPYHPAYIDLSGFMLHISRDDLGNFHDVTYQAVSNNGEWLVYKFREIGIIRIHTTDMSVTWIAPSEQESIFLAISNDGKNIASAGFRDNLLRIYLVNNCGLTNDVLPNEWFHASNTTACSYKNLSSEINQAFQRTVHAVRSQPGFNDDVTELTLDVQVDELDEEREIIEPFSHESSESSLDYLALGDSYTSGEGDTEKNTSGSSYYTQVTGAKGGCHISTRSYPFLLAQFNNMPADRFQSVACSGARIAKDYYGDSSNYSGQANRMKAKTDLEQQAAKEDAASNFTPGIIKQIEFVKKTKPKTVTLTGGGNDVGFASLLAYCAMPAIGGAYSNTCELAISGTKQRSVLGDAIRTQYDLMVKLITAIKEASSETTIYVIGYPSFIAEDNATCINALTLNMAERKTINQSVTYLNQVLQHAAQVSGAFYVDITDSLAGGRICEGSSLMTGPLAVIGFDVLEHKSEMFHPNRLGHEKIARSIQAFGFEIGAVNPPKDDSVSIPDKPASFGSSEYIRTLQDKLVQDSIVYAREELRLLLSPGIFALDSAVDFTIWSNETHLGRFSTDEEGGLNSRITLPDSVTPGYHLLLAEGRAPNGERLRIYEFIEVQATAADHDGDGILNNADTCEYLRHWFDERTRDDVCLSSDDAPSGQPASATAVNGTISNALSNSRQNGYTPGFSTDSNPLIDGPSSIAQIDTDTAKILGAMDVGVKTATSKDPMITSMKLSPLLLLAMVALIIFGLIARRRRASGS